MEKYIYLCYANSDEKIAGQMCEFLEKKGFQCFFRHRDIPVDDRDNSMFEESSVSDAACVVVIFSKNFVKSDKLKLMNVSTNKYIAFVVDNLDLKDFGVAGAKKINAVNHPEKMLGHVLPDIKMLVGERKLSMKKISVIGFVSLIVLICVLFSIFNHFENDDKELRKPNYKEITYDDFRKLYNKARNTETAQNVLPFRGISFGMTLKEFNYIMDKNIKASDIPYNINDVNGIELPGDAEKRPYEFITTTGLKITVNALINENDKLYGIHCLFERNSAVVTNSNPLIDDVVDFMETINSKKYDDFNKWYVTRVGALDPFYCLSKDNEIIIIRQESPTEVVALYRNVPQIPKEIFETDNRTYEFNKRHFK